VGQLLHGSARTTAALRRTIQHSQESIARLAARYDLNAKTVAKWRKRDTVEDAPMGHASLIRLFSPRSKRPASLPSASGRCWRSTIVCTLCKRASPI
jgi:hypothetical protein